MSSLIIFKRMIALVEARGVEIPIKHCSNSAGIVEIPECNMDMVRAGITLYGLWPSEEVDKSKISLKPVMSLHSRVAYVKELEPGRHIRLRRHIYGRASYEDSNCPGGIW